MKPYITLLLLLLTILPVSGKNKERITERGSSLFYRSWRYPVVEEKRRDTLEAEKLPVDSVAVVDSLPVDSLPSDTTPLLEAIPNDALTDNGAPLEDHSSVDDGTGALDGGAEAGNKADGNKVSGNQPNDRDAATPMVARPDINTCIVYFIFDQSNFITDYTAEFDTIMAFIDYHKGKDFEVVGHTDERGTVAYNQGLSERRAKKVYDVLVRRGVDPTRLTMIGRSELELAIPHAKNEKEHLLNRRVVVRVKRE